MMNDNQLNSAKTLAITAVWSVLLLLDAPRLWAPSEPVIWPTSRWTTDIALARRSPLRPTTASVSWVSLARRWCRRPSMEPRWVARARWPHALSAFCLIGGDALPSAPQCQCSSSAFCHVSSLACLSLRGPHYPSLCKNRHEIIRCSPARRAPRAYRRDAKRVTVASLGRSHSGCRPRMTSSGRSVTMILFRA